MKATIHSKSPIVLSAALALVAGSILSAAPGAAAAATPAGDVPSVVVRYADLDLTSDRGAHILYRRIQGAANVVCPQPDIRDLKAIVEAHACREQAIARAVQTVSSPQLAAIYAANPKRG
ncbi:MAG TPA: UrcA family protein [Steroidobacteraceae bacterium]|jgi:UrcA family protein